MSGKTSKPRSSGKSKDSRGFVVGHESVDAARRPGPGETKDTSEHPTAAPDTEGQNSGRRMSEELFLSATDDDAGALPHQLPSNVGPTPEGGNPPPRPEREPRSLPDESPSL